MNHPRREGLPSVLPVPGGITRFPEPVLPTRAYRARMYGKCPDCGMSRRVCRAVGGCQP